MDRVTPILPQRARPEIIRAYCFALLVTTSVVVGTIAGASKQLLEPAMYLLWMPAYLLWVISDLRVRRAVGLSFALQLSISLVPLLGLLLYLLWSRRLVGAAQWAVFIVALWIPAFLAAGLAHGIVQVVRGEQW